MMPEPKTPSHTSPTQYSSATCHHFYLQSRLHHLCPSFVEPSARFRTPSGTKPPAALDHGWWTGGPACPSPLHCCVAERLPSVCCVLQVAEHNRHGVFSAEMGAKTPEERVSVVSARGWRPRQGKKATQTAAVLLLLDKTTLCLLEGGCDYNHVYAGNGEPLFSRTTTNLLLRVCITHRGESSSAVS